MWCQSIEVLNPYEATIEALEREHSSKIAKRKNLLARLLEWRFSHG